MPELTVRPFRVTILTVFVLCITSWNAIRAYSAIANWDILREFGAPPAYIMTTGLIWSVTGLGLMYTLWVGKRLAFFGSLTVTGLYVAWYWFDRLVMQPSPAPNLGFSMVVSGLLAAIFLFGIVLAKDFFDK